MTRLDSEPLLVGDTSAPIGWIESRRIVWPLILLIFFAAIAPTLRWFEFYFGSEAVNVATALEMNRDRNWLLPTLQGEPRLAKPPLTAWITAACIRSETMRQLSDRNPKIRAAAYRDLAWEVRWPGLLGACVMLVAAYELGRAVGGPHVGVITPLIAGSTIMFLRHGRLMQTDLQLAVWVAVASAFLANALLCRATWLNVVGAGVALGVALLAKGPVALLMTVIPIGLFVWYRGQRVRIGMRWIVALAAMLIVGLWWYAWIALTHPDAWKTFLVEATRYGANQLEADKWSKYLSSFPWLFLPWTPLLALGLVIAFRSTARARGSAIALPLFMLFVPFLVMCCFKERKDRYLIPLLAPAAVIAAEGAVTIGRAIPVRYRATLLAMSVIATLAINIFLCARHGSDSQSIMKPLADAAFAAAPDATLYGYVPPQTGTQSAYLLVPGAETAIYLNRPVHWTTDPASMEPAPRPQFLLVIRPDDVRFPEPSGRWTLLTESHRRGVSRSIFIIPPNP